MLNCKIVRYHKDERSRTNKNWEEKVPGTDVVVKVSQVSTISLDKSFDLKIPYGRHLFDVKKVRFLTRDMPVIPKGYEAWDHFEFRNVLFLAGGIISGELQPSFSYRKIRSLDFVNGFLCYENKPVVKAKVLRYRRGGIGATGLVF